MRPPITLNVLDRHNGFTAMTRSKQYVKIVMGINGEREATADDYTDGVLCAHFVRWDKVMRESSTLWRPAEILKGNTLGTLDNFDENSFYQNYNDVTKAYYKVRGYAYRIVVWFDNSSGERLA